MIQGSTIHEGGKAAKISTWWDGIADPFERAGQRIGIDHSAAQAVDACVACYHQCRECCYASLLHADANDSSAVNSWLDCAALCMTSAMLIARNSDLGAAAATLCARACDRCLDELDRRDDCAWGDCIAACSNAAAACREFVSASQRF